MDVKYYTRGRVVLRNNGTLRPDQAAVCDCIQRATNFAIAANMHDSLVTALSNTIIELSRLAALQPGGCDSNIEDVIAKAKTALTQPINK